MTFNEKIAALLGGKKPVGFETLTLNSGGVTALNPPAQTLPEDRIYIAVMVVKADTSEAGSNHIVRFREDGVDPTTAVGMTLGDAWVYELQGYEQISKWRGIGTNGDALVNTKISVTYYKLGDQ